MSWFHMICFEESPLGSPAAVLRHAERATRPRAALPADERAGSVSRRRMPCAAGRVG